MHGVTLFGITMRVNYNCFKGQGHSKNRISFVATKKYFTLSRVSYRFFSFQSFSDLNENPLKSRQSAPPL